MNRPIWFRPSAIAVGYVIAQFVGQRIDTGGWRSRSTWPGTPATVVGVDSIAGSWWTFVGLGAIAATLVGLAVVQKRRDFADMPGEPAVLIDGHPPRLGPPTALCAANNHYRCDGRSKVGRDTVFQCSCSCHIPQG